MTEVYCVRSSLKKILVLRKLSTFTIATIQHAHACMTEKSLPGHYDVNMCFNVHQNSDIYRTCRVALLYLLITKYINKTRKKSKKDPNSLFTMQPKDHAKYNSESRTLETSPEWRQQTLPYQYCRWSSLGIFLSLVYCSRWYGI